MKYLSTGVLLILILIFCKDPYHIIIGGYSGSVMTSVELFNWKKKKLCQLPNLPWGVSNFNALNVNGTALICGGLGLSSGCLKLNKATKTWSSVCFTLFRLNYSELQML